MYFYYSVSLIFLCVCVCGVITWQEFHLLLLIGMSSSVAIISLLIVWKMEWKSWRERGKKVKFTDVANISITV